MTFMESVMRSRKDVKEKGLKTSTVLENRTALTLGYVLIDVGLLFPRLNVHLRYFSL